jgi:hypothetical protein
MNGRRACEVSAVPRMFLPDIQDLATIIDHLIFIATHLIRLLRESLNASLQSIDRHYPILPSIACHDAAIDEI